MQFSYYNNARQTESKTLILVLIIQLNYNYTVFITSAHWILELTVASYSEDGKTPFLIKSNSAGYHWNYQQKSNVIRLQEASEKLMI